MKNSINAFTFASSEVNKFSQTFIKIVEFFSGKLTLKKLYDQYLLESNSPENFWHDALKKLRLNLVTNFHFSKDIPIRGSLIVVANHAFGVVDGVSICSIISSVRQDYKMITHKVLRQAEAVKDKIIPIDFSGTKEAILNNIQARKSAEDFLKDGGIIIIFPSGTIATKSNIFKDHKADEGDWKQFAAKLTLKTNAGVLPMFFEGQNSFFFHLANKIGQTFRYSLMMFELKKKIGDTIKVHIGNVIDNNTLTEIGNIKEITKYIRKKTYNLDPN